VYIDAFAGTGYREQHVARAIDYGLVFAEDELLTQPEPQQFLDGSARIALKVDPPFHRYTFVELDPRRAAELEKLKVDFPALAGAIEVRCGEANATIQAICRSWDRGKSRGVLFLDPFGMQVDWSTVQAVAQTRAIDVWILFPFAVNRLLTRSPNDIPQAWRDRINATFGSEEWLTKFYKPRTIEDIFNGPETVVEKALPIEGLGVYYQERLQTVFPVVAPNPRILRNTRNSPLFQLFFAAANPGRGGKIALKIAQHILTKI
jgi:three-Cys-motif partner protein